MATVEESTAQPTNPSTEQHDDGYYPEEEVVSGNWITPQVDVSEVQVSTGEEGEEVFWKHRSKLYRWAKESSEWKERGLGESRLLKHKETGRIRFLLRQEKTLKVVANHFVIPKHPYCKLEPNAGSEKIWVWSVPDYADEEAGVVEQFALKFGQPEQAKIFQEKFNEACEINRKAFGLPEEEKTEEKEEEAEEAEEEEKTEEEKKEKEEKAEEKTEDKKDE